MKVSSTTTMSIKCNGRCDNSNAVTVHDIDQLTPMQGKSRSQREEEIGTQAAAERGTSNGLAERCCQIEATTAKGVDAKQVVVRQSSNRFLPYE